MPAGSRCLPGSARSTTTRVSSDAAILGQVDQIVANAPAALAAAGTTAENVVQSTIYVVSEDPGAPSSVWDRLTGSSIGPAFTTASILLGVAVLGYRDQLVQVDLTAALP